MPREIVNVVITSTVKAYATFLGFILQEYPNIDLAKFVSNAYGGSYGSSYEAKVLKGVWAAAPYLHNGSVQSITEILKPTIVRVKVFKVSSNYDIDKIGLVVNQSELSSVTQTTDCSDLNSGNSNCGHEYGTTLSQDSNSTT